MTGDETDISNGGHGLRCWVDCRRGGVGYDSSGLKRCAAGNNSHTASDLSEADGRSVSGTRPAFASLT